jgi:hypothetical protein
MKYLGVKTQNAAGGTPLWKENLGYVVTFIGRSEDYISVDAFEGQGLRYKKREQPEIRIVQNGVELFVGDKHDLFNLLTNTQQNEK